MSLDPKTVGEATMEEVLKLAHEAIIAGVFKFEGNSIPHTTSNAVLYAVSLMECVEEYFNVDGGKPEQIVKINSNGYPIGFDVVNFGQIADQLNATKTRLNESLEACKKRLSVANEKPLRGYTEEPEPKVRKSRADIKLHQAILAMSEYGVKAPVIAEALGCSVPTVYRIVAKNSEDSGDE